LELSREGGVPKSPAAGRTTPKPKTAPSRWPAINLRPRQGNPPDRTHRTRAGGRGDEEGDEV